MTQRTVATLVAAPLLVLLFLVAVLVPLPYATYAPGLTVDVLGTEAQTDDDGSDAEIIQVEGHEVFRDDGEIRMTTVYVSVPEARKSLVSLVGTWLDRDKAVYPHDSVHQKTDTREQNRIEGAIDMVTSQDRAIAVAMQEMDLEVEPAISVAHVADGEPADGKLEVRDHFLKVNGVDITTTEDVVNAISKTAKGKDAVVVVERDRKQQTVRIPVKLVDGQPRVGVTLGTSYRFPFDVSVNLSDNIGGPSAGLMFSLAVYDTLTPGSLTDGHSIAGTGTIAPDGSVGPIGGIQQKIAGARDDGAELFLVPPANCDEALGARNGDVRLVRADTMHDARTAIDAWTEDSNATLPSCEDA